MCKWVQPLDGMQTRHMTGHTNNRPAHTNRWTWSDGAHRVKEGPSKERWWRLVQPLWNIKCTSERPPNCSSFVHLCPDKEGPAWPNWFWSSLPLNWFLQDFPDNISTLATQLECHAPERLPNCIWFPGLYPLFYYPGRKDHRWNVFNIRILICPYPDWNLHIAVQYFFDAWVSSSWANN